MRGRVAVAVALTLALLAGPARAQADRPGPGRPLILVHDMPWFQSKPIGGRWGWHWTMGRLDPEKRDPSGRREVASHIYPLIGPYDSTDPDVLEYHTLLMRVAGVDGAIADWYGIDDFNDYAAIHRGTTLLREALARRGLRFAVCYEDRALRAMVERGALAADRAAERAGVHLKFCEETWFRDPLYATWKGEPVLLAFGPDYLVAAQWERALAGLRRAPAFLTLHERRPPAVGSFAWPPMWASKGGRLDPKDLDAYLDRFARQDGAKIPCAFPGFHDFYREAGVGPSYGYLDPLGGETFRRTLARALASGEPLVQVATWNDFGEGTAIEPSREHGYSYLEAIQEARRRAPGEPFPYLADDLRLPLRIFRLRKAIPAGSPLAKSLDEAAGRLLAPDPGDARRRLDAIGREARVDPDRAD